MELAWEFSLKEGTDFERQDKGLLQVGASVCSGLVRLEPRCGASSILQGFLGQMESLRRDRCPQAKAFKPGKSTVLQGQRDIESLRGTLGLPLSFHPAAAAAVGNTEWRPLPSRNFQTLVLPPC